MQGLAVERYYLLLTTIAPDGSNTTMTILSPPLRAVNSTSPSAPGGLSLNSTGANGTYPNSTNGNGASSPVAPAAQVSLTAGGFVPYFSYNGELDVKGVVGPMTTSGTTQSFAYQLEGVDPECASGAGAAGNSCGIHVHSGNSCTSDALGHFYMGTVTTDPWTTIAYTSSSYGTASGSVTVDTGASSAQVAGRALIIHGYDGRRISCALLRIQAPSPAAANYTLLLTPATSYLVSVRAENALGIGAPSATLAFQTCTEAPGPPGLFTTPFNRTTTSISLGWRPPQIDGHPFDNGAPITRYRVYWRRLASAGLAASTGAPIETSATEVVVHGLVAGRPYVFNVAAYNGVNRTYDGITGEGLGDGCDREGNGDGWGVLSEDSPTMYPLAVAPEPPEPVVALLREGPLLLRVEWCACGANVETPGQPPTCRTSHLSQWTISLAWPRPCPPVPDATPDCDPDCDPDPDPDPDPDLDPKPDRDLEHPRLKGRPTTTTARPSRPTRSMSTARCLDRPGWGGLCSCAPRSTTATYRAP